MNTINTYMQKKEDVKRTWYLVDAEDAILGRLSAKIAKMLIGKNKPQYTPHVDISDFIVVINAAKIRVTGKKLSQKNYLRFSGYPGGLKSETLEHLLKRKPELVITHAVKGMLPRNCLGRDMLTRLKVYSNDKHPHSAQKPTKIDL